MFVFEDEIKYGNAVVDKSFAFGVRIVKYYKYSVERSNNLEAVFKQVLRSGTSIGANISESQSAYTKKDFINKMGIALKEARETEYWLKLLKETGYLNQDEFKSLFSDCEELLKLLTSIIKKSKDNLK